MRFSGGAGGEVGQRGYSESRGLQFFYVKRNENHQVGTGSFRTSQNSITN